MRVPVDADLFFFVASIASVLSSLPKLRSLPTSIVPVQYAIEDVSQAALTEAQAKYFAPYDEKLAAMNYWPVCTYRVTNYGRNLIRNYANPLDTARCVVMINEFPLGQAGKVSNSCTISFHTRFTDGTILTTRNMQVKSILDSPPYQVVQERPGMTDPAQMKRDHDRRAATMGQPVPAPADTNSVFSDVQSEHQRFSDFQLANGSYRLLPDNDSYELTDQVHWRAICNHLNPLAQNLSMRRFLPGALIAIALPMLAVTILAPATLHAPNIGVSPFVAARCVVLICYLAAGALLGWLLQRNTFLWALFLIYLPMRILMLIPFGAPPDATLAAIAAYLVAQARKRSHPVLSDASA